MESDLIVMGQRWVWHGHVALGFPEMVRENLRKPYPRENLCISIEKAWTPNSATEGRGAETYQACGEEETRLDVKVRENLVRNELLTWAVGE